MLTFIGLIAQRSNTEHRNFSIPGTPTVSTHDSRPRSEAAAGFRDWAAETTHYPNEVVEMALAHTIKNQAEAAYRRGDLMEKRSQLMADWTRYCDQGNQASR